MRLFEIETHLRSIIENGFSVDQETGEVLGDKKSLNELKVSKENKILAIAKIIREKESFAEAIRNQEKAMADRRKTLEAEAQHMKSYILSCSYVGDKYSDDTIQIGVSKGRPSVNITGDVPAEYCRTKIEVDKILIAETLKEGKELSFAKFSDSISLRIK